LDIIRDKKEPEFNNIKSQITTATLQHYLLNLIAPGKIKLKSIDVVRLMW